MLEYSRRPFWQSSEIKQKDSGISYQQCLQLFMQEEFFKNFRNLDMMIFKVLKRRFVYLHSYKL